MKKDEKDLTKSTKNSITEEIEYSVEEVSKTERELDAQLERVVVIGDDPKTQNKLAKRQRKEEKAKNRVEKVLSKQKKPKKNVFAKTKFTEVGSDAENPQLPLTQKSAKKALFDRKDLKEKKVKEPKNYELAFKEFPVKMVKEVSKIRWSSKQGLLIKFIQVILFILVFAILFYFIDLAFQELFTLMRVI